MRALIVFLIRKRLGLKKYEYFRFANQKSDAKYFFADEAVIKIENDWPELSGVSLNWLLDDDCEIVKVD